MTKTVLFLGKKDDSYCLEALGFTHQVGFNVVTYLGDWGDPLPKLDDWHGDYIISYLSRWVVPAWLIERASIAAINFHPASPDYPGIGCNNFALYDEATKYGVTCHFMAPRVDTGAIIRTRRFPVLASDNVVSLLDRTYREQLHLYKQVIKSIAAGAKLVPSGEQWTRPPYTRAEFNQLGRITPDMSPDEVRRRVRATSFGQWQPTVEIAGFTFVLKP